MLTEINKETEEIWEENQEIFVYIGRNYKEERSLPSKKYSFDIVRRSITDLFQITVEWKILLNSNYYYYIEFLCKKLNEDELIVMDLHREKTDYFRILFSKADHLCEILPAVSCPSFKIEKNILYSFYEFAEDIYKINSSWNKAIVIEKQSEALTMYSIFSPILRLISIENWKTSTKKLTDDMYDQCQQENWSCRPTILQVASSCTKENNEIIFSLQWTKKINEAKFDLHFTSCSTKTVLNDLLEKFPYGNFNFIISKDNYNNDVSCLFSGKLWTLVFNEDILTLKWSYLRKNNKQFRIRRKMIESNCKSLVAMNLSYIKLEDIQFAKNHSSLAFDEFANSIKPLTISNWDVYMIIEKTELIINSSCNSVNSDMNYLKNLHQAYISIYDNNYNEDEEILDMVERLPKKIAYSLIIPNPQSKALNLMNNYIFIKMINKLKVRIQWGGIEIETKWIDKNGVEALRKKLEKEINIIKAWNK